MASTSRRRFEAEDGRSGGVVEFMSRFSDERACADYLLDSRNPGGWVCPRCGNRRCTPMPGRPHSHRCTRCPEQVSVTAGTSMEGTKVPPASGSTPSTSCRTRSAASPARSSPAPSRPTSGPARACSPAYAGPWPGWSALGALDGVVRAGRLRWAAREAVAGARPRPPGTGSRGAPPGPSGSAASEPARVSWRTVGGACGRVCDGLLAAGGGSLLRSLRRAGVDETGRRKGQRRPAVVAGHDRGRQVLGAFLDELDAATGGGGCAALEVAAADGARWIADVVAERCPNAECVADPSRKGRGVAVNRAKTAIAREFAGWVHYVATMEAWRGMTVSGMDARRHSLPRSPRCRWCRDDPRSNFCAAREAR